LLSASRGAWIALLLACIIVELLHAKQRRALLLAGLGAAAVIVSLAKLPTCAMTNLHTIRGRFFIWTIAWKLICASRGMGIGLNQFQFHFYDTQRELLGRGWQDYAANASMVTRAHNEYLDFLVEGGVCMLAAWLVFLFAQARIIYARRGLPGTAGYSGILIYMALVSLVSFPLHIASNLLWLALAAAGLNATGETPGASVTLTPARRLLVCWACFAALVCIGYSQLSEISGQVNYRKAEVLVSEGRFQEAESRILKSLASSPKNYEAGLCYARLLYRRFQSRAALETLDRLESYGKTVDERRLKGLVYQDLKEWDKAEVLYKDIVVETFPREDRLVTLKPR